MDTKINISSQILEKFVKFENKAKRSNHKCN